MPEGSSRTDYEAELAKIRSEKRTGETVHPREEVCSREIMRTAGKQPRILLTNVKQLELLLTRQRDIELFTDARLDFLVFDEAHTFTGAQGSETACLIRRLRAFYGREEQDSVCVATSATIVDQENPEAARDFATRFFGVSGMVHNSERQRLLVFCDNRQDAAFQAGWMKNHARRFRLRALMYESQKAVSEDDTWRHIKIILKPNNPDFQPIELTCEDEGSIQVIAEFLEIIS